MRRPGYLAGYTPFGKNMQVQPPPPPPSEIVASLPAASSQPSAPSATPPPTRQPTPRVAPPQLPPPRRASADPAFLARINALQAQVARGPAAGGPPRSPGRPASFAPPATESAEEED